MGLIVGLNSWASQAEADAYLADRLNAAEWTAADSATKDQALVTAWNYLTSHPGYSLSAGTGTQAMKDAQCEQALFLLKNIDELEDRMAMISQGIERVQLIGGFIENYEGVVVPLANLAKAKLDALKTPGTPFGSAEITRDDEKGATL